MARSRPARDVAGSCTRSVDGASWKRGVSDTVGCLPEVGELIGDVIHFACIGMVIYNFQVSEVLVSPSSYYKDDFFWVGKEACSGKEKLTHKDNDGRLRINQLLQSRPLVL